MADRRQRLVQNNRSTPKPIKTRMSSVMVMNEVMSMTREMLSKAFLDKKGRDLNKECGYPEFLTIRDFRQMYDREGIGKRVNNVHADECWKALPEVYDDETETETPFDKDWKNLNKRINILAYLHRLDQLSGIGSYGILLLGFPGKLDQPPPGIDKDGNRTTGKSDLLYVRPFDEYLVQIDEYDTNENSPRFGLPTLYNIEFADLTQLGSRQPFEGSAKTATMRNVHWTRIIHAADNKMSSDVWAVPRMKPVYNRLLDIRKILGSSAEMFYNGAFPGISFEEVPGLDGAVEMDEESVREQFLKYQTGLQRYLALTGVTAKPLAPSIIGPEKHMEEQYRAICCALDVPLRIFLGSESAHLASTQDIQTWNGRISRRRKEYCEASLILPTVNRLVSVGALSAPKDGNIFTQWPDLNTMNDKDLADVSLKKAQAILQYVTSGAETILPPLNFWTEIMNLPLERAKSIVTAMTNAPKKVTDPLWDPKKQKPLVAGAGNGTSTTKRPAARNSLGSKA